MGLFEGSLENLLKKDMKEEKKEERLLTFLWQITQEKIRLDSLLMKGEGGPDYPQKMQALQKKEDEIVRQLRKITKKEDKDVHDMVRKHIGEMMERAR